MDVLNFLGCFVRLNKRWKSLFEDKEEPKFVNTLTIYDTADQHIVWHATVPRGTFFIEELKYKSEIKYRIWKENQMYIETSKEQALELMNMKLKQPWLWLGSYDGIDLTLYIQQYLLPGNTITLQILNSIVATKVEEWTYMCPETFEMKEFPIFA